MKNKPGIKENKLKNNYFMKSLFQINWKIIMKLFIIIVYNEIACCQTVEIQGQLKLNPVFINENNNASYALVLDTNDAVAFKSVYNIGVPSTGFLLSELENNSFLVNAGFSKKGKFVIPFEQDASLLGPGSFSSVDTLNNPPAMDASKAVWTGTEMIVWDCDQNAGGKYNPATDLWSSMSTAFSPDPRQIFSTVWTGTEMIVWGGTDGSNQSFNTGSKYNPNTNTWTPMSTVNAPNRYGNTAIWTGTEMIIWGGISSNVPFVVTNTGSKYNPSTDTWTTISSSNAPNATTYHTAVWTGTEMIVHGGFNNNTTKKYNPLSNTWTTLNHSGVTRFLHTAIWTGTEMIVWGGTNSINTPILGLNSGGIYNVNTNSWTSTTVTEAPSLRVSHSAVWTGTEMIIWGGINNDIATNTGARFNPISNSWISTSTINAPSPRYSHTNIWTGIEHIIWGGGGDNNVVYDDGAKYNPISNGYLPPININMYLYSKN